MSTILYQMAPIARKRDAVGRMALGLTALAREMGFPSLLFTERQESFLHFGPLRKGLLETTPAWAGLVSPRVSLYHHSIGTAVAERFLEWPAEKKILVYHNITPPSLFPSPAEAPPDLVRGLEQLPSLIAASDLQIGLSAFSCEELRALGATRVIQLPYFLWRRAYQPVGPAGPVRNPTVLVVGRVTRHKRVLETLEAFRLLHSRKPESRLAIVGSLKGDVEYVASLERYIERERLGEAVRLHGKISDRQLARLYAKARVLLTLSEHEGFCVPIVEAMRAGVPVVAFAAGAIPETLGEGGILLRDRSAEIVAAALERILENEETRETIRAAQAKEVDRFSRKTFSLGLRNALKQLGIES